MTIDLEHLATALRRETIDLTEGAAIVRRLDPEEREEVYTAIADCYDIMKFRAAVKKSSRRSALDVNNPEIQYLAQRRII